MDTDDAVRVESGAYRSGYWRCACGFVVVSHDGPPDKCPSHPERACYPDDLDPDWKPLILAATIPPVGEWGEIECAKCGHEFVDLNSEKTFSWVCPGCKGDITPRGRASRVVGEENDSQETEQATLVTDGGKDTAIKRDPGECPGCGRNGTEHPLLANQYVCKRCVITFTADGKVTHERRRTRGEQSSAIRHLPSISRTLTVMSTQRRPVATSGAPAWRRLPRRRPRRSPRPS